MRRHRKAVERKSCAKRMQRKVEGGAGVIVQCAIAMNEVM